MSTKAQQIREKEVTSGDEVPEGWASVPLGQAATLQRGFDLPAHQRRNGDIPVYAANGQVGVHNVARVRGPGVVTGRSGTIGRVSFIKDDFWPLNTSLYVKDFHGNDEKFIALLLRTFGLEQYLAGTGVPTLNRNVVHEIPVAVPPLHEQRRIVCKFEELEAEVQRSLQYLSRAPQILKHFRQVVLAAACSGKLTEDWRRQARLTAISETIKNILSLRKTLWARAYGSVKAFKPPGEIETDSLPPLPDGWEYVSSDLLFSFVTSGSRGWAKYYADTGATFLRVGNLDHVSIALDLSQIQHVKPPEGLERRRAQVGPGDILISITADVGMIGLVPEGIGEAYVNQHVAIARPVETKFSEYLAWFLSSESGQQQLQALQRGATKVGLGLEDIRAVAIPFPPVEEQAEILSRITVLFKLADAIEKRVAAATIRAEKLTQTILSKAFRGELVPTEAELARSEGREYEPAAALLERIRAEREKAAEHGISKKKTK